MPPWPAAKGLGDFSNDHSLSGVELELLTAWVDGNTPLGVAGPERVEAAGAAATADLVITVPAASIGDTRVDHVVARAPTRRPRWISGWSFAAGDPAIVERAVVSIKGHNAIGSWVPGDEATEFPAGAGILLPANAVLDVAFHFRKTAAAGIPASRLELRFRESALNSVRHRELACGANLIEERVEALSVTPLAAAAGDALEVAARRPDGSTEPLVVIPHFDPGYPVTYRFRKRIDLPIGTVVSVRGETAGCRADIEFIRPTAGSAAPPRP